MTFKVMTLSGHTVDIPSSRVEDRFTQLIRHLVQAGIQHGHDYNQWQELASTAMNYHLPQNERNLLSPYLPVYEF